MSTLTTFLTGFVCGLFIAWFGWFFALGGAVFALQNVPFEEWWFGLFSWALDSFNTEPGSFVIGLLFGASFGTGGASQKSS